ncbi:MAG: M48 family metallopeptidase [Nitrospirae bacterium]|nr:M48 family metallopeptidase [Nitrospirota bacterium]
MEQLDLFQTNETRLLSLEKDFSLKLEKKTKIIVTQNRSHLITVQKKGNHEVHLRVQEVFLHAPHAVWEAIGTFILSPTFQARRIIRDFIARSRPARDSKTARHRLKLNTQGVYYQLKPLFDAVNIENFNQEINCQITWGRTYSRRRRRSISFGTFENFSNLIKINPALDDSKVPEFFIKYILYHEMLHAKFEEKNSREAGRKIHHSKEFYEWERKFPDYEKAIEWEKKNIRLFVK